MGVNHPGPYQWKHGWIPLTAEAAAEHFRSPNTLAAEKALSANLAKHAEPKVGAEAERSASGAVSGKSFTPDQRSALHSYTRSGYMDMNAQLRGGSSTPETRALSSMIASSRLPESVKVQRGVEDQSYLPQNDLSGHTVVNKGFVSTTFDPADAEFFSGANFKNADTGEAIASGPAVFDITVPKGSNALPASAIEGGSENELILPHGTQLNVQSDQFHTVNGNQVRWITAEAVTPTRSNQRLAS